ncbi:hypothetical protein, partial [Sinorhizobium fredii]|uniref:hypothetical protein n=1 Tax=Rhizobium fredii TaxID=380 RepID=UPI001AEBAC01
DALLPRDLDKCLQMTKLDARVDHRKHNSGVNGSAQNIILPNQMKWPIWWGGELPCNSPV